MPARRARLGTAHAVAWVAYALAAAAMVADAVGRDGGPLAIAFGAACAVAAAALGLLAPARIAPRTLLVAAAALALVAGAAGGALALLGEPPQLVVTAALGLAAGLHTVATRAAVAADPVLAPRVRPAPTLLAAAVGTILVAVAQLLPTIGFGAALITAAVLQLLVIALAAAARPDGPDRAAWTSNIGSTNLERVHEPLAGGVQRAPRAAPQLLALLAIAVAGAVALAALRPALSAIGANDPQAAGPLALTLVIGALLGPPLAMLIDRVGGSPSAVLATIAGITALVAPIARPGVLDWIAAVSLGIALAACVALAERARRAGQRLPTGTAALLVLAGAAGAGIAALLLGAVPLPDVVLGAALACLVAGIGIWVPGVAIRQPA